MQLVVVKHKKFKDIPRTEFYFEDIQDMKESLILLREENYIINLSLNVKKIENEDLKEILNLNIDIESNQELYKIYKESEEEI